MPDLQLGFSFEERQLSLERPLAFFDLETTGTIVGLDRIVEIGIVRSDVSGERLLFHSRVNPEMHIPIEATQIHGIGDADVLGQPTFYEIGPAIVGFLENCDLGGFNVVGFDVPMLCTEFDRVGLKFSLEGRQIVDAMRIFHLKRPRDLTAAYSYYCGRSDLRAHSASDDAQAAFDVLLGQLQMYPDLPTDPAGLATYCTPSADRYLDSGHWLIPRDTEAAFAFGKYKGRLVKEVAIRDSSYIEWILEKKDVPGDTKSILRSNSGRS